MTADSSMLIALLGEMAHQGHDPVVLGRLLGPPPVDPGNGVGEAGVEVGVDRSDGVRREVHDVLIGTRSAALSPSVDAADRRTPR